MFIRKVVLVNVLLGLAAVFVACGTEGSPADTPDIQATTDAAVRATAAAQATPTPIPTSTPTATAKPSPVALPTNGTVPTPTPTALVPTPTSTPTATPTSTPAPEPILYSFSGQGTQVLGPMDLKEGLVFVLASHDGSSNFIVKIVDATGGEELSINEIGSYGGTRAHPVSSGEFFGLEPGANRVQVDADGNWSLNIRQEFPETGSPPPLQFDEVGDDVIKWVLLEEGQHILKSSHMGSSSFIVALFKSDGSSLHLIVNEIGRHEGENLVLVGSEIFGLQPEPGIYALVVQADGAWSVSLD